MVDVEFGIILTGVVKPTTAEIPQQWMAISATMHLDCLLLLDHPTFAAGHPERSRSRRFTLEVSFPIFSSLWIDVTNAALKDGSTDPRLRILLSYLTSTLNMAIIAWGVKSYHRASSRTQQSSEICCKMEASLCHLRQSLPWSVFTHTYQEAPIEAL